MAARAVKAATTTIPIVVAVSADFLGPGLVTSLAHPGGNLTGMTDQVADLAAKEVQLLKEMLPRMQRLALISKRKPCGGARRGGYAGRRPQTGVAFPVLLVTNAGEIEQAFEGNAAKRRANAVIVMHTPLTVGLRVQIAELALKKRLPLMSAPTHPVPWAGA